MRIKVFLIFIFLLCSSSGARAEDVNAKDRAYDLLMSRILQQNVGTQYGERYTGSAIGMKNPYRDRPTQKVLVACIAWGEATASQIPIKYWNSLYNTRSIFHAREEALTFCRSQGKAGCDCQVIDENDQNVLQVPAAYSPKLDSKSGVQSNKPSPNLQIVQVPAEQAPERRVPIALSWEGVGDLLPGQLTYTQGAKSSAFEISLPLLDERCAGHMTLSDALPGKRANSGVWAFACPGQKGATGTFQVSADGNGTCVGQDFQGRAVKCAFSEK